MIYRLQELVMICRCCLGALICTISISSYACTEVAFINKGDYVSARNFDWQKIPSFIVINQKHVWRSAVKIPAKYHPAMWYAKYGSVTVDLAEKNNSINYASVLDGMNQAGLTASQTWLGKSSYAILVNNKKTIANTQLVQYLLDTSKNVSQAISNLAKVQVYQMVYDGYKTKLHFVVSDVEGNSAVIDFVNGKMIVNKTNIQNNTSAISNDTYQNSVRSYNKFKSQNSSLPMAYNSQARYIRARYFLTHRPTNKSATNIAFQAANFVLEPSSSSTPTVWSAVRDMSNKVYIVKIIGKNKKYSINLNKNNFLQTRKIPFD